VSELPRKRRAESAGGRKTGAVGDLGNTEFRRVKQLARLFKPQISAEIVNAGAV
jgi:hypothetical protein